ncbi:ABC transporter ATP-binding protein [Syntrophomonas palmitatica]|uniref:ABC transporter ATP-binding protein n=1 Tax=Syntrophomonas palmitatica TaxID=402877 RepID=UPI0006CF84E8|nr:ABC transporter ATP-binding protein [Syntrophomonas palmitatica]
MAARIELRNLCKSFHSLQVLHDWNLTVNEAEKVVLLGPSGSGKTTFLRLLAGLETPTSGSISMNRQRISFVFQEPRLIPWRSVKDNLLFVNPQADVTSILTNLQLSGFEDYLPGELSGGMRQRVNLARALISEPDLLILDEAFTSLDLPTKLKISTDLLDQWKLNKFTLLAVTHDLKEALYLADRILVLSSSPARILYDFKIELGDKRSFSDPELLALESHLLEIISGI